MSQICCGQVPGTAGLCALVTGSADAIGNAIHDPDVVPRLMAEHGAVLLRCSELGSAEAFRELLDGMPGELADYADGISPRTEVCCVQCRGTQLTAI